MTSFLIISRDKEKRIAYARKFCNEQSINPFDISLIELDTTASATKQSIGIEDVKRFQKTVFLKPIKSKFKAVIIEDAHLLTTEAQNALLKVLEEPPAHTLLLLGANSKDALLPTIQSRCQIVELETEKLELTTRERNSITQFIEELPTMSVGAKLKRAELLAKDKDKAIEWIEKVIIVKREQMLQNVHEETSQSFLNSPLSVLNSLQTLHITLKTTNVNPRFAIENTLLNI